MIFDRWDLKKLTIFLQNVEQIKTVKLLLSIKYLQIIWFLMILIKFGQTIKFQ